MFVFGAYAMVQAGQLGKSTPTYDVYDSDNYPQASHLHRVLGLVCVAHNAAQGLLQPRLAEAPTALDSYQ